MKLIIELKTPHLLNIYDRSTVEGWILGVPELSAYTDALYSWEELEINVIKIHQKGQKAYINARKIFSEPEINKIPEILDKLQSFEVDGYFYGDFGFFQICQEMQIVNLIYQVNTYMTNAFDIKIMCQENIGVTISTELNYQEIEKIVSEVKGLYLNIFGCFPIFHSRRSLMTNYFEFRHDVFKKNCQYDIVEELRNSHYPIKEDENGTVIYLDGYYYLEKELLKLLKVTEDINLLITGLFLDDKQYSEVIKKYVEMFENLKTSSNIDLNMETLDISLTKGLLYQKSKLLKKEADDE